MELIIAFIIAMVLLWLAAEPETLADYSDRMHVNRLADRSRARKAPGARQRCRYVGAGWRPDRRLTHG